MPGADTGQNGPVALDVRLLPTTEREAIVLRCCAELAVDQWLLLIHDKDPLELHQQLEASHPEQFGWAYVDRGSDGAWRIRITRLARAAVATG